MEFTQNNNTTFSTNSAEYSNKQIEINNWLKTPEADMKFVMEMIGSNAQHENNSIHKQESWLKAIARQFDVDWEEIQTFGLTNPTSFLPQTVVRNIMRTVESSGIMDMVTKFENVQAVAWNIIVRSDFANPEAWNTANNAHVWSLDDEGTVATLKLEQNLKIININIQAGFIYKYITLPRRLTVLHPQLVGMVLEELADEVVRSIESQIMWGNILQTDDTNAPLPANPNGVTGAQWLNPIDPTVNTVAANRVFTVTPATTNILSIISTMRTAYSFWNGMEEAPHLIMNRTAYRSLYLAILAKLQSLVAINDPIKAILGYKKEEIEKELGIKIHIVADYNMQDDPYMVNGADAKFVLGDMKAYGLLLPDGLSQSFSFFRLNRNTEELVNEVLIGGDVVNIGKLFYVNYTV